jgi:hypothetical protein
MALAHLLLFVSRIVEMRGRSRISSTSDGLLLNMEKAMRTTRTAKMMMYAMVCVLGLASAAMAADEPALSVDVSAAFMSKYIWRGQLLSDDYAFQPSVGVSYGGLSASLWGNMDLTDYRKFHGLGEQADAGEFSEYDWTIGYGDKLPGVDFLSYSIGVIYYYFPSLTDDGDTVEVYAGLSLDAPLSPTVTVYRDIDEGDCTYVAFAVSHSIEKIFELSPDMPVGMDISASIGWGNEAYNKFYWDSTQTYETGSSLQDLTVSVGFPIPVMGWTLTPSVTYVTLLDSDVRKTDSYSTYSGNRGSDYVFTGLTLSRSF